MRQFSILFLKLVYYYINNHVLPFKLSININTNENQLNLTKLLVIEEKLKEVHITLESGVSQKKKKKKISREWRGFGDPLIL